METLIQQATRHNQERYQNDQGKLAPFAGMVVSVTPNTDEFALTFGAAASRTMPVQHPFSGINSWLRSMPEVGSVFLLQNRFDSGQPEALKAIPVFPRDKADEYQSGLNFYRSLNPGEHDIVSIGQAMAYFSRRGNLDLRSGASVKVQLDREQQETRIQSPTVRHNLLYNTLGQMGDEQRIGIVKRWTDASSEFYVKSTDGADNFLSEHYIQLTNPAKAGPAVLIEHTEGQVVDENGDVVNHQTTALPLRSQHLWFTTTDESLTQQIDQNGNLLFDFPSTASTGMELQINSGSYRAVIGVDRDITIDGDEKVVVQQNINYTVGSDVQYDITGDYTINSGSNALTMTASAGEINFQNATSYGYAATATELTITGPAGTTITVDVTGGVSVMTAAGAGLNITAAGQVALGGVQGELLMLINLLVTAIGTLTAETPLGPSLALSGSPQWQQVVQPLLTQLTSITGTLG